jgi:hypothetical protein
MEVNLGFGREGSGRKDVAGSKALDLQVDVAGLNSQLSSSSQ